MSYRQRYPKRTTDLEHTLAWYVDRYGLCLSTVRNHRRLLDHPKALYMELAWTIPALRLKKLREFIRETTGE